MSCTSWQSSQMCLFLSRSTKWKHFYHVPDNKKCCLHAYCWLAFVINAICYGQMQKSKWYTLVNRFCCQSSDGSFWMSSFCILFVVFVYNVNDYTKINVLRCQKNAVFISGMRRFQRKYTSSSSSQLLASNFRFQWGWPLLSLLYWFSL